MKTYRKIVSTITQTELDSHICDFCSKKIVESPGAYEVSTASVKMSIGINYPEDSYGETTSVDICVECFKGKLMPWAESQGAKFYKKDWNRPC
jgi:hypothetical protein